MAGILMRFLSLVFIFQFSHVPRFTNNTRYALVCQGDDSYYENSSLLSFDTILGNGVNKNGFGPGLGDPDGPSETSEGFVEETSFAHEGWNPIPLPSALALIEIGPAQESVWPSFAALRSFFDQTLECFHTYLRELPRKLGFRLEAQDHTRPSEIYFSDKPETVVEETSFAHEGWDPTPLPSALTLIEIGPAQESVWPSFAALRSFFHQTLECFHIYLRELSRKLGFQLEAQDHTRRSEIYLSHKPETVVEEKSFAHDGWDPTPLPSALALIEIGPAQESVWPSFAALRSFFHQTLECFHTYLRELPRKLGFRLEAEDHTRPSEIYFSDKPETVVEETSFAHDSWDPTPLPSALALIEIVPAQESVWPSFAALRSFFHQTLECFHTYLRELLSKLGFRLEAQNHPRPSEIYFSDKPETVVEETSFAHDGWNPTPLPSALALIEIGPAQESVWPSFAALRSFFHQTLECFHTYLRELLRSKLGIRLEAENHTRPSEMYLSHKPETVVEETSFAHDGGDPAPLPSALALIEIGPAQESVWPSFAALRSFFHQTLECFHTYLRELLIKHGFRLEAQDHTRPSEIYLSHKPETVVEETSFAHDGWDPTPLPSALAVIEIGPAQESAWPSFAALRSFFHQTLECLHTYLRELLRSKLCFRLEAQNHTRPSEIYFSHKPETIVEETSFAHEGWDPTPLPSALALIEIGPAQESVWPSFAALRSFFHQTLECFQTYLRELLSKLGFRLEAQNHTRPSEIYLSHKPDTVVEETSFAHDSQDGNPLPSALALIETSPAQESAWPSFSALRSFFHQTLECFHTYLKEPIGSLVEEWQPNSALHEWSSRVLFVMATVEAVLILGSVFIVRYIVKFAFQHTEEELDQVYEKLLNQQKQTRAVEKRAEELQLQVCERERPFQELQVREAQGHLSYTDRKCRERERALKRKHVKELEEARTMQEREELMAYKRRIKKNHQTHSTAEVSLQEELLSFEIREARRIPTLLAQMKSAMDEMDGLICDSMARTSKSQFPHPETERAEELQLQVCERERPFQELQVREAQGHLSSTDRKCRERERALNRKHVKESEEARMMQEREELMAYKRKMKKNHQTNSTAEVTLQEELLSFEIREARRIPTLLAQMKSAMDEMDGLIFDSMARSPKSQFPHPETDTHGTQTD